MSVPETPTDGQAENPKPVMLVVDVCEHATGLDRDAMMDGSPDWTDVHKCPRCCYNCTVRLATPADHARALGLDANALLLGGKAHKRLFGSKLCALDAAAKLVREGESQ